MRFCGSVALATLTVSTAMVMAWSAAAKPTAAQIGAVRQACRSDYQAHCADVPPGGAPALACLQKNLASLSAACQTAVNAAAGQAPATTAPAAAPAESTADTPAAPAAAPEESSAAPAPAPAPAPAAAGAAPAQAGGGHKPTQAQVSRIRQACRADFGANCAGIKPGGSAALACLRQHRPVSRRVPTSTRGRQRGRQLPRRRGGAGEPSAAAAPPRSPREELARICFACGGDFRAFCRGVPPGGGRVIGCLKANAASLSPRCQRALVSIRAGR